DAVAFLVRIFRYAAAAGESKPELFEDRERTRIDRVAWIGERHRSRNAAAGELRVDRLDLLFEPGQVFFRRRHVIASVIADLEAVAIQFRDLLPGQVIGLVGTERESLADEERCTKV